MRSLYPYILDAVILLVLVFGVDCVKEKMKCYQCEVTDTNLCTTDYLQDCPKDQAYDRCLTRISKTKTDGVVIYKSCALAPCTLRDQSQTTGLGLDHCDRSQDEYDCISCCKESGCNTGRGAQFQPSIAVLIILLSFTTGLKIIFIT